MRKTLKVLAAGLAVIALCAPFVFWPMDEARPGGLQASTATVTVPPTVVVPTTIPPSQSTTTASIPDPSESTTSTTQPLRITIAAVGDVLTHMPIVESVHDPTSDSYDFRPVFAPVAPYLQQADYTVANLETKLAGKSRGFSGYPRFNSPGELADALKDSGIDLVATANNHALDMGWNGLVTTLDRLDRAGLAHVGTYRSREESMTPVVVDVEGVKVAFLNYTVGLNETTMLEDHPYVVDVLNVDKVVGDAADARLHGAEVVIALLHHGNEYDREPSEKQVEVSRLLLSQGVDVILGSHPHVVQPISHILDYSGWKAADKYIVYSLGNFVSSQRWRYSDSGLVAFVHIEKLGLRAYVTGVSYLPVYVQEGTLKGETTYRVLPVLPGLEPTTDTVLTVFDRDRMASVWEELRPLLYSPNQGIVPLDPDELFYLRPR